MILKNKGMFLEVLINNSIKKINQDNLAFILKMPIDSNIISYDSNIIKSSLKINNFCDYVGIFNGIYIEFEAKETEKKYFPLQNIKPNQVKKLNKINEHKGISFVLIYFHIFNEIFLMPSIHIKEFKVKKIPYEYFCSNYQKINFENGFIDLISIINHLISYT
ncbi:Holliday junction-specific endonuclease [Spiroplasma corruscae]|uniref:Holliday junction resolvase RecU n=1 Tax=Spiroplasma corruscae TaxID=216934 RepID=A0A222EPV3_9MOLU|nr:Holliday junction resolvase RecU [Spiroplasma corruscae]ASP28568.1 Holliday junction-specific endonuclease [Spiroplasma corruscae]